MVVGAPRYKGRDSASSSEVSLNLRIVFSHILEARKPSQLAGLINHSGVDFKAIPKLRETMPQSVLLFVSF